MIMKRIVFVVLATVCVINVFSQGLTLADSLRINSNFTSSWSYFPAVADYCPSVILFKRICCPIKRIGFN